MVFIKIFHFISLTLLTLCLLAAHNDVLIYWLVWMVYAALLFGLVLDDIWCARLLLLPPVLLVLSSVPMVLYNFYAFASGNPRYQDSPATIIVVAIFAFFFTVPSLFVLAAYWTQRQRIFGSQ